MAKGVCVCLSAFIWKWEEKQTNKVILYMKESSFLNGFAIGLSVSFLSLSNIVWKWHLQLYIGKCVVIMQQWRQLWYSIRNSDPKKLFDFITLKLEVGCKLNESFHNFRSLIAIWVFCDLKTKILLFYCMSATVFL